MREDGLSQKSCAEFSELLEAKVSVPGGGGAAALVGALGVALCSMVGNYTVGKEKYASSEERIREMLSEGAAIRRKLLELIEADAEAFEPLSKAYGIAKDDPSRAKILEEATMNALQAPLEMMRQICRAIALLEEMGQIGSRMLLSDVACGALACGAAIQMAAANVFVNTRSLANRQEAEHINKICNDVLETAVPRAQAIADSIADSLRG